MGAPQNKPQKLHTGLQQSIILLALQGASTEGGLDKHQSTLGQIPLYGVGPHTAAHTLWSLQIFTVSNPEGQFH